MFSLITLPLTKQNLELSGSYHFHIYINYTKAIFFKLKHTYTCICYLPNMADFGDNSLIFLIFSNFLKNMSMKCKADVLRGFILSCITRERLVPILNCFVLLSFIFIYFWGGGGFRMHSVERQEQKVLLTINVKFYCFHFILLLGVCVCMCVGWGWYAYFPFFSVRYRTGN